ncbi:transglutaminase-like domain-containing protein [Amphritea pacifica]|uniref:Transglutaminase domain-containing protein n=1 Tax=Amphritea pacifica TaxID=2811233 RepID=A0ABS2WAB6_9GAMM|nr:transglutaminase-like domain-containing protein [Amphritea pacifica]MBN0988660.1 transglutaminase domain-containing protein [Amphritea pacifica]MBN1005406.1 transglutaminase domain-containing protein [Amphritea pacifica]
MLKRLGQGALFILVIILTSALQQHQRSPDLMIAEALERLPLPSDPNASPGLLRSGSLQLMANGITLNQLDIDKILNKHREKPSIYLFGQADLGAYIMIAPGVDRRYHLVNSYFDGYMPFRVENPVLALYTVARRKKYQFDHITYPGRPEVWQSSQQAFFSEVGDCEDHAILVADWLIGLGYDARVVVGDYDGEGHAWVVLFAEGQEFLLETTRKRGLNRLKAFPLARLQTKYHPTFMFNNTDFWQNQGSRFTTDYASSDWVKRSHYLADR